MNLRGLISGVLSNILGTALMFGATLIIKEILAPDEFGKFRVAASFATAMLPLFMLGSERVVSRFIQDDIGNLSGLYCLVRFVILVLIVGTVILSLLYYPIIYFILNGNVSLPLYLMSIWVIPFWGAYNLSNTIWRHRGDAGAAQVDLNFSQRLLRSPLLIGFVSFQPVALYAAAAMLVSQVISAFRIRKHILPAFFFPAKKGMPERRILTEMVYVGTPLIILAVIDRADVLLINHFVTVSAAGDFDLAWMIALMLMFPAMALSKIAEPRLKYIEDPASSAKLTHLRKWTFGLNLLMLGALYALMEYALLTGSISNYVTIMQYALLIGLGVSAASPYGPVLEALQIKGFSTLVLRRVLWAMLLGFGVKIFLLSETQSVYSLCVVTAGTLLWTRYSLAADLRRITGVNFSGWRVKAASFGLFIIGTICLALRFGVLERYVFVWSL